MLTLETGLAKFDTSGTKAIVHKQKDDDPLKVLVMNCQSIIDRRAILNLSNSLSYPEIVIGTESCLNLSINSL